MPADRRARLVELLGGSASAAQTDQIRAVVDLGLDTLVSNSVAAGAPAALALARASNELAAEGEAGLLLAQAADELAAEADNGLDRPQNPFTTIVVMESGGKLSATQSKAVLSASVQAISAAIQSGASVTAAVARSDPGALAKEMGFEALGADTLAAVVADVIAKNPEEWARLVGGDDATTKKLRGFFTGEVMKATSGQANGSEVAAELGRRLRG
jgi:Asp-tRNA(Asn)/Glu-tRNA(Gln) amidotransferase B subunit